MRFVQFADTHLGLGAMKSDLCTAFARACALAVDRKADLVLIPGDLFDYETVDRETASFVARTLQSVAPIPVFVAPGNHDSLRPGSPYFGNWPSNVHIFTAPEFETVALDSLDCSITGIAHAHRGITSRALIEPIDKPARTVSFLLFHGSRDGYKPSEKETVIPFSDAELLDQGFTYAAVGHYHSFSPISDSSCIRAAYSGCAQGRGLDETGEKCVLVGEIDAHGRVEIEKVEVAERRVVRVDVDVTGSRDQADVIAKVDASLSGLAREQDVVYAFLRGMLPPGMDVDTSLWESRQPYFAATLNTSGIEPDYDLDTLSQDSAAASLRSTFVRKMLERQKSEENNEQRRMLRDAIYYGLYALDGRRLEPRDAD